MIKKFLALLISMSMLATLLPADFVLAIDAADVETAFIEEVITEETADPAFMGEAISVEISDEEMAETDEEIKESDETVIAISPKEDDEITVNIVAETAETITEEQTVIEIPYENADSEISEVNSESNSVGSDIIFCETVELEESNGNDVPVEEAAMGEITHLGLMAAGEPSTEGEAESSDIDFKKYEKETSATGKEGSETGIENVHTICLDVLPPEKRDIAVLLVMDTTSSMVSSCASCGASKDYHPGGTVSYANWEGDKVSSDACNSFVERKGISEAAAAKFISDLGTLSQNMDSLYVRIVPFGGEAVTNYTNWIDLRKTGGVETAQKKIQDMPQKSGTNISAGLRSAYDILSGDLPSGVSAENTYVLMMTDGSQSKSDLANLPAAALKEAFVTKWLNKWQNNYGHFEVIENENIDKGFYIGSPYYAELITDKEGLGSHLYTVLLGTNLDYGAKVGIEKNQQYNPGIGIDSKDFMASFSDYSAFVTSADDMSSYYNNIIDTLSASLESITVTDPMSDYVDFLTLTDSDGKSKTNSEAIYDKETRTITWNPKTTDTDGHYRLYYNVRLKTEAAGFVGGQEYPTNKTTTAKYKLKYPDEHTEDRQKNSDIPKIKGSVPGELSFTKVSEKGDPLPGAQFKMVHDDDCPCGIESTISDITFASGNNGIATASNILSGHTYKLSETAAPTGYQTFDGALTVTVSYGKVTVSESADIWKQEGNIYYLTNESLASKPVWVLEADENHDGTIKEKSFDTIHEALEYLAKDPKNAIPTENGTIHIEVREDISEDGDYADPYYFDLSGYGKDLKTVEIYSKDNDSLTITASGTNVTKANPVTEIVNFAGEGTVYTHHFNLVNSFVACATNGGTSDGETTTKLTNLTVDCNIPIVRLAAVKASGSSANRVSDNYIVNSNRFEEYGDYSFTVYYQGDCNIVFNDNYIERFRAIAVSALASGAEVNVEVKRNTFYHLVDYAVVGTIGGTCVALCQYTGDLNGRFDFENNTLLGFFRKGSEDLAVKAPGVLVQHTYQGISDDTEIIIKNNTLQCGIAEFAFKSGTGSSFETRDQTKDLLEHTYSDASYTAEVSGNTKVHLYPDAAGEHDDADRCHVCPECGQIFLQVKTNGSGKVEYEESEGVWADAETASGTIAKNLDWKELVNNKKIDVNENIEKTGICIDKNADVAFKITPTKKGGFEKLTFTGKASDQDVTADVTTTDEGKTYQYTFTNISSEIVGEDDYYTKCPWLLCEMHEGGPFYVKSLEKDFPTLQEAVDKAAETDIIVIHPCEDYEVTEYDASYATYNEDHIGEDGGEVYIEGKSLTIKSEDGKDTAPLKDFAIVVEGQAEGLDYTFDDIKFTGSSIIIFDNYEANANFGKITVTGCDTNTCTSTSGRSLLKYPTHNLGLTHSSSAFLQWVQYPPNVHAKNGTTKELVFTGNTVKGTLHPTNPGKDQPSSPAYTPYISGGAGVGKVTITGNTFGDYAHAGNAIYGIVFQTVVDGADINVSNNTAYMCNRSSTFVWVGEFQTTTKIYDVNINVNNNDIYTGTKWAPTRPYSLNSTFDVATPAFNVVRINDNLNGKAVTHHNYVNKFCYNYIKNSVMYASTFEVDSQIGHTDDERIIEVPKGYKKFNDIYLFGKADTFTGGDHADREIGDDHYCKVCDELIELEATFTYTAVCKKELAEGESFGSVTPTEEKVGKVTGTPAGSVAEAADGFCFIGWFDNEACEGTALSTELTYVPPVVRDEDELLIGDDFYALFERDTSELTITKEAEPFNSKDRFIFTVTGSDDYSVKVVVEAGKSVTIKAIPLGEYTVKEDTAWSWRYTTDDDSQSITVVADSSENKVTFTNTLETKKWLSGSDAAVNKVSGKNK